MLTMPTFFDILLTNISLACSKRDANNERRRSSPVNSRKYTVRWIDWRSG